MRRAEKKEGGKLGKLEIILNYTLLTFLAILNGGAEASLRLEEPLKITGKTF
jgi:hypothetical protein